MQYQITDTEAHIQATYGELIRWELQGLRIYATPTHQGKIRALYVEASPRYPGDYVFASVEDFCKAEGWFGLGYEGMSQDALAQSAADLLAIRLPL